MKRILCGLAALLALAGPLIAQPRSYPTGPGATGGVVTGILPLCFNSQGFAVPCPLSDNEPNVTAPFKSATPQARARVITISPNSGAPGQYPTGALPITGNSTGTTGAVVGTLAAATGRLTYICGFNVSAIGGTAAVGPITLAGLIGSSMVYQMASTASGNLVGQTFTPCIPASAVNTAITITTTADGTATGVDVNSWGFQQ